MKNTIHLVHLAALALLTLLGLTATAQAVGDRPPPDALEICQRDADCPGDAFCYQRYCYPTHVATREACVIDDQCPRDSIGCVPVDGDFDDGDDVRFCAECEVDDQCGGDDICHGGVCEPMVGLGEPCVVETQCGRDAAGCVDVSAPDDRPDFVCAECSSHMHCADGEHCAAGVCERRAPYNEPCDEDTVCATDAECTEVAAGDWRCAACIVGAGTCGDGRFCTDTLQCADHVAIGDRCHHQRNECGDDAYCHGDAHSATCTAKQLNHEELGCAEVGGDKACLSHYCVGAGWASTCAACSDAHGCGAGFVCGDDGNCAPAPQAVYHDSLETCIANPTCKPEDSTCTTAVTHKDHYIYKHEARDGDHISGSFTLVGGVVSAATANGDLAEAGLANSNHGDAPADYVWIGGRSEATAGVFGQAGNLFAVEASATQANGVQDSTLLVEVLGMHLYDESISISIGWSKTTTLLAAEATFYAVKVSGDISGTIGFDAGLTLGATGMAIDVTPKADAVLTLFAGVGVACVDAGLQAEVTLLDAELPIKAQFTNGGEGISWTLDIQREIDALGGEVDLVVEACGLTKTKTLVSWDPIDISDGEMLSSSGCIGL